VLLPPSRLRLAGAIEWARPLEEPPAFARGRKRLKGRRGQGLRYEARAKEYLEGLFPEAFVPGPWFQFKCLGESKVRFCQPDGLLILPQEGKLVVVEIKLQHTSDAWWQLKWLYLPVLAAVFPPDLWAHAPLELVKWYDCATAFPEPVRLRESPLGAEAGQFSVHIWAP